MEDCLLTTSQTDDMQNVMSVRINNRSLCSVTNKTTKRCARTGDKPEAKNNQSHLSAKTEERVQALTKSVQLKQDPVFPPFFPQAYLTLAGTLFSF